MKRAIIAAALLLAGCQTPAEPEVRTVRVNVPVPVSCVPSDARIEPEFRVSRGDVATAYDAAERLRLSAAGFLEREAYITEQLPVLRGCKG